MPPLPETLAPAAHEDVLELDELWSFVARRRNKMLEQAAGVARALPAHPAGRGVWAYALGDRGERTCRLLWERVPLALHHALTFADFWEAYQKVVPGGQHVACGKGSGQTNHVERFNNTLRQRLARFVRQTLSFSKSDEMHEDCLRTRTACGCSCTTTTRRWPPAWPRANNTYETATEAGNTDAIQILKQFGP